MSGRPGSAARGTRRPASTATQPQPRRAAGFGRLHRQDAAVGRRLVAIDAREVARRRERRQRVVADLNEHHRAEHRPGRCRASRASSPLPGRRGAESHLVPDQHRRRSASPRRTPAHARAAARPEKRRDRVTPAERVQAVTQFSRQPHPPRRIRSRAPARQRRHSAAGRGGHYGAHARASPRSLSCGKRASTGIDHGRNELVSCPRHRTSTSA